MPRYRVQHPLCVLILPLGHYWPQHQWLLPWGLLPESQIQHSCSSGTWTAWRSTLMKWKFMGCLMKLRFLTTARTPVKTLSLPGTEGHTYEAFIWIKMMTSSPGNSLSNASLIWDLDVCGNYLGLCRLFQKKNHFLAVGVPASPCSMKKPPSVFLQPSPKKREAQELQNRHESSSRSLQGWMLYTPR